MLGRSFAPAGKAIAPEPLSRAAARMPGSASVEQDAPTALGWSAACALPPQEIARAPLTRVNARANDRGSDSGIADLSKNDTLGRHIHPPNRTSAGRKRGSLQRELEK